MIHQFVFWQNILSIHQASFLTSLSHFHKVILVVEKDIDNRRIRDGWDIPDFGYVQIVIKPNKEILYSMFDSKDVIHIFSGFRSYELGSKAFDIALTKRQPIGIMSEPFNWIGIKGKIRFLKYLYYKQKYNKKISFILAIGNKGRWCFEKTGFSKKKIFDWGYFTISHNELNFSRNKYDNSKKILFVGNIGQRKNILELVNICINQKKENIALTIIGTGPLEEVLKEKIKDYSFIRFLGKKEHSEIYKYFLESNLFVLPSIFDGWGAVVNESLMCGAPVITSDYCGASVLIKGIRGRIFSVKEDNLESTLLSFLKELPYGIDKRMQIKEWADNFISGEAAARYFLEIIEFLSTNKNKPTAPWFKEE